MSVVAGGLLTGSYCAMADCAHACAGSSHMTDVLEEEKYAKQWLGAHLSYMVS